MPGPVHPRLIRRAGATRNYLVASVLVGALTAGLLIAQAKLIADAVTTVFDTAALPSGWRLSLLLLLGVFAARGGLAWLNAWLAHRSAAAVKSQLRRDVMAARLATPVGGAPSATVMRVVTQGLDALDGYFSKYLPQLGLAATVPFIVGAAVLLADWPSAIIIAFTLPLIPIFMALIGWTTQAATAKSFAQAERLANHFADLIAGLPTLQAFARARAQRRGVELGEEAHRSATMRTLRISFISSLALELLATLSVAVVAVTIGFRVVYGQVDFTTALFVLILAPEAFLPVRQVGVHFHDSADGVAAADAAFAIIDAAPTTSGSLRCDELCEEPFETVASLPPQEPPRKGASRTTEQRAAAAPFEARSSHLKEHTGPPPTPVPHLPAGTPPRVPEGCSPSESDASRTREQRASSRRAATDENSPHLPAGTPPRVPEGCSPSESDASRTREQRASSRRAVHLHDVSYRYPGSDTDAVSGFSLTLTPGEVVALAGPSGAGKSTVLALVSGYLRPTAGRVTVNGVDLAQIDPASWRQHLAWVAQEPGMVNGTVGDNVALGSPGASAEAIAEALRDAGAGFDATKPVGDDAEGLSAGERRRVALARALLRIRTTDAAILLLDEPTAGLDADTEATVIDAVRASGAGALIVTHRPAVLAAADRVVDWEVAQA